MISELDETIRQILIREGQFDPSQIDISFDIPNREWSQGISRPTLNCYLFDIRENLHLRHQGQTIDGHGTPAASRRPTNIRYDLTYLLTAWTRAVEDEHRMLWRALQVLGRLPTLPQEFLQGILQEHVAPIYASTARPDNVLKSPAEFWSALENQIKPSLSYTVVLSMDREAIPAGPPVSSIILQVRQPGTESDTLFWFGGTVRGQNGEPISGATVHVEGRGQQATTDNNGRFRLPGLAPGRYTLVAQFDGKTERSDVEIPVLTYDITLSPNTKGGDSAH